MKDYDIIVSEKLSSGGSFTFLIDLHKIRKYWNFIRSIKAKWCLCVQPHCDDYSGSSTIPVIEYHNDASVII